MSNLTTFSSAAYDPLATLANVSGRYRFSNLTERQKVLAIMFHAYELWEDRVRFEKWGDWEPAANKMKDKFGRWPKDYEIRPFAIENHKARVARELSNGVTEEYKSLLEKRKTDCKTAAAKHIFPLPWCLNWSHCLLTIYVAVPQYTSAIYLRK